MNSCCCTSLLWERELREKDIAGNSVKGLREVPIAHTHSSSLVHRCHLFVVEGPLPLVEPCWLSRITFLSSECLSRASRRICPIISQAQRWG